MITILVIFVFQSNPKLVEILSKTKGQPRKRFQHVYDLCKGKNICEGGDTMDQQFDANVAGEEQQGDKKVSQSTGSRNLSKAGTINDCSIEVLT